MMAVVGVLVVLAAVRSLTTAQGATPALHFARWTWSTTTSSGEISLPDYGVAVSLDTTTGNAPSPSAGAGRSFVAGPDPEAVHVAVSNPQGRIGMVIASDTQVTNRLRVVFYYRVPAGLQHTRDAAGIPPVGTSDYVTRPYLLGIRPGNAVPPGGTVELYAQTAAADPVVVPTSDRAAWIALFRRKPDFVTVTVDSGTWFGDVENGATDGAIGTWTGDGKELGDGSLPRATPTANGGWNGTTRSTSTSSKSRADDAAAASSAAREGWGTPRVSVGDDATCARRRTGQVLCWGLNNLGQLGNGTEFDHARPGLVHGIGDASSVSTGNGTVCALRRAGTVDCWGDGTDGAVGNGKADYQRLPAQVVGLDDAIAVKTGYQIACAIRRDRTVACWGDTTLLTNGALFDVEHKTPVQMPHLTGVRALAFAGMTACALLATGRVACWGQEQFGEFGDGNKRSSKAPVLVPGIAHAQAIAGDGNTYCALVEGGTVACWGNPDITNTYPNAIWHGPRHPWTITGITDAVSITSTCAIRRNRTAACWGESTTGDHGVYSKPVSFYRAIPVPGLDHIKSISAGGGTACAIRQVAASPTLYCWGLDAGTGKLDNVNNLAPTPQPALITGL